MSRQEESKLQRAIMKWANLAAKTDPRLETLYAIPNGAHVTTINRMRLVSEGLKKGMPDLCLPVRSRDGQYSNLFLEVKVKNSKPTEVQKECHKLLEAHGNRVVVVRSLDEAIEYLMFW